MSNDASRSHPTPPIPEPGPQQGAATRKRRASSIARPYFPAKTFDDDLAALVELFKQHQWTFTGVDVNILAQDVIEQREERMARAKAEAEARALQTTFNLRQEDRVRRYTAALNAARGAFRHDAVLSAVLNLFKRERRSRGTSNADTTPLQSTGPATSSSGVKSAA